MSLLGFIKNICSFSSENKDEKVAQRQITSAFNRLRNSVLANLDGLKAELENRSYQSMYFGYEIKPSWLASQFRTSAEWITADQVRSNKSYQDTQECLKLLGIKMELKKVFCEAGKFPNAKITISLITDTPHPQIDSPPVEPPNGLR